MMNIKILLISLMGFATSASAAPSTAELALNNYYRDQASKQIEQILPKGKFSVQVELKVSTAKIKSELEPQSVKLPLGGSFVSSSELVASGVIDQKIEQLTKYVESANIIVSLAPGTATQTQELITSMIQSMMGLDFKRGDKITFVDLPQSVITAWTPEPSIEIYKKPVMILSGFFALILLLTGIVITFGLKNISTHITKESRMLGNSLKEAIDGSGGMKQSPMPSVGPLSAPIQQNKSEKFEPMTSQFWDKIDTATLTAFCYDCISQPAYYSIPSMMVGTILDQEKAIEVENNLPADVVRNFSEKSSFTTADVMHLFQKHQSEYRRAARSPMSQQVLKVAVSRLIVFTSELKNMEIALLINSLTPLKRSSLLKMLSTEVKMGLAQTSKENLSIVEHKKFEVSLIEKIMKITKTDNKSEEYHSLNYLTSIILKTETYAEDEALYEKMNHQGEYQGVLLAFDHFKTADWEEFNPQDLAIAFAGYSEKYKSSVMANFSGKKLDWVKNFFSKYEKAQPDFHSDQVETIHGMIQAKIKTIQTVGGEHSEEDKKAV